MDANQFITQCKAELGLKFYKWTPREGNIMKPGYQGCIDFLSLVSKDRDNYNQCRLMVFQLQLPGYMLLGRTWDEVYEKLKHYAERWAEEREAKLKVKEKPHDDSNRSQGHGG
jgi:hypothetical protein